MTASLHPIALVVDDDDLSSELLSYVLESQGYYVHSVVSVDQAIAFVQKTSPNLIVLDYVLPDRTGTDLLDYLEATGWLPVTEVILSTAYPKTHFSDHHLSMVTFLPKPTRLKALRDLLNGAVAAQYAS